MASVRKLQSGRWQAQFRPVPGGKQITRTDPRKAVVERWLEEQIASKVSGTFVNPRDGRTTFASYYAEWSARQIWTHGTRRAMDLTVSSATFADTPLRSIRRAHVELWVKAMQTQDRGTDAAGNIRQGLAPQTIKTRLINARTIFRAAVVDRKIATDPTMGVRLPQARKASNAMQIPTANELRGTLAAAAPHQRALFALCAFAGLRLGEASALKVGDIDFLNRMISVRRQAQKTRGSTLEIRLPKYGSERTVAAADGLLTLLAAHIALLGLQGLPDAFLFTSEQGGPAAPSTVHHAWMAARSKGSRTAYHLHDLRHYYASGLIAAGCDVSTVQHALGHSSATTLRVYTHLWPKADDRTRAAAQGMFDDALGSADEFLTNAAATSA